MRHGSLKEVRIVMGCGKYEIGGVPSRMSVHALMWRTHVWQGEERASISDGTR
jgi:hypothetical protein